MRTDTDRANVNVGAVLAIVLALSISAIVGAFLLPVAVNSIEDPTTDTITQDVGETVEVDPLLNATLDSANDGVNATYTLNQTDNTNTVQKTIAVGSNATFSLDNGDVTVNVSEANAGNATADFSYDKDFSYGDAARSIWGLLGLALVLVLFIATLRIGMKAT